MQRLTARFLLLFALTGTFVPLALAIAAPAPHACCRRKAAHACHNSAGDEREFRAAGCCDQSSCRAITTRHSARPPASPNADFAPHTTIRIAGLITDSPAQIVTESNSSRAPPQLS
jgi:hypothetical protein